MPVNGRYPGDSVRGRVHIGKFNSPPRRGSGGGSDRKGCRRFLAIAILASPALAVVLSIGTYLAWPS